MKSNFEELDPQEALGIKGKEKEKTPEYMEGVVERISGLYIKAAERHLPEGVLRRQIIKFYSDPERLFEELSNVFRDKSPEQIDQVIERVEEKLEDKDTFINYAVTKDFSTSK